MTEEHTGNQIFLAEHARKCLKVEYIGGIECDFQKSRVTGPWNHKVSASAIKSNNKVHACVPLINVRFRNIMYRI